MTRVLRFAVLLILVAVTFFYPLVAPPPHRIDDAHFDLIRVGMTEEDVAGIFGVPPGNYGWAVYDEMHFFPPALALVVRAPNRVHDAVLGGIVPADDDMVILTLEEAVEAKVFPWERESRTWASRHGAYRIHLGQDGTVLQANKLGKTRVEYPWRRWQRVWSQR